MPSRLWVKWIFITIYNQKIHIFFFYNKPKIEHGIISSSHTKMKINEYRICVSFSSVLVSVVTVLSGKVFNAFSLIKIKSS